MRNSIPRKTIIKTTSFKVNSLATNDVNNSNDMATYLKEKEFVEMAKRLSVLDDSISNYFQTILKEHIKEIETAAALFPKGQNFVNELLEYAKDKNASSENKLKYIREIDQVILKSKNETIEKLKKCQINQDGNYDELLTKYELEIKSFITENQKLKLYIETAQIRINKLCKEISEKEEIINKTTNEKRNLFRELEKNKLNSIEDKGQFCKQLELQESQIRQYREKAEELQFRFSQSKFDLRQSVSSKGSRNQNIIVSRSSTVFPNTEKKSFYGKILENTPNEQADSLNKQITHKLIQAYKKNSNDASQYDYKINRIEIQVQQKDAEIKKLEKRCSDLYEELKKTKEHQNEDDRKKWIASLSSDNNPISNNFLRKKVEERDKKIQELERKVNKFAVLEKKIFVKEKAFEIERQDYHDKLLYLNDRVSNLSNFVEKARDVNVQNEISSKAPAYIFFS